MKVKSDHRSKFSNLSNWKDGVEVFHNHSNSINAKIQSTVGMPTTTMGKKNIAFLQYCVKVMQAKCMNVIFFPVIF